MVSGHQTSEADDARAIMQALHTLKSNPQLLEEARTDLPATLDRMGIFGIARHAVAATLVLGVADVLLIPGTPVFWSTP